MKRITLMGILLAALVVLCACGTKGSVVGIWSCELYGSEQVIEFTSDGKFIDHTLTKVFDSTMNTENRYRIHNASVEIYVEGDPASVVALEYSVKDDVLTLGGVAYQRIERTSLSDGTKAGIE